MSEKTSPILVTGGAGFLGWHLARRLGDEGFDVLATMHRTDVEFARAKVWRIELASSKVVESLLDRLRPAAIVHTAALTQTQACEEDPAAARRANIEATQTLVRATQEVQAGALPYFVFTSTDLVFDGESAPYEETAKTGPVMEYGRTKVAAEGVVSSYPGEWTILRPALMYGLPTPVRASFLNWILEPLREGRETTLFIDEWRTPVLVDDVVEAIVRLIRKPSPGIFHCGGSLRLSRWEMGERIARRWKLPISGLRAARRSEVNLACPRPRDVSLVTGRLASAIGLRPSGFEEGLERLP